MRTIPWFAEVSVAPLRRLESLVILGSSDLTGQGS
jgi:hypothetical protein